MIKQAAAGVAVRALAASVLDAVAHDGRSLKAELDAALSRLEDPRDRALLEAICFGALRERARYDAALRQWMQKAPGARDGLLRTLLWTGFVQIDVLGLPAHAALSATVDAARELKRPHQAGLVNALLRRAQREGVPAADPALAWPQWLRTRIEQDWPAHAAAIFEASARPAPLWLRINRSRSSAAVYLERLQRERPELQATLSPLLPDAVRVDTPVAVTTLPGFAEGVIAVQDGAAQCVADALAPETGARVLDACAAPGGKAAHVLERDPTLDLLALDIDARRLRRVRENLERAGVQAHLHAADAAAPATWWDGRAFDAILLDAPCSATGVVRRQPDILLHRRAEDLDALVATQARLLDACWPMLRPGGVLLYATCSVLKAENELQITNLLARTPQLRLDPLPETLGHARDGMRQRFPGEHEMDGFFYARLIRQE